MTAPVPDTPSVPPKVDPETLVLRGAPSRVVRFRRGAIIGLAALTSTALIGVTWVALKPATFRTVTSSAERADAPNKAPPDALASAPASYGDVPVLGPPLPGDLGRPILEHQRSTGAASSAAPVSDAAARAAQEAEAERQRIAADRTAARQSAVMVQLAGGASASHPPLAEGRQPTGAPVSAPQVSGPLGEGGVNRQSRLAIPSDDDRTGSVSPHRLLAPVSPWTLRAGSVIAASLITGLNSDLPGLVTAQVIQNVYDSATGRTVLIPQGSRVIGTYDNVVAFGQRRALVAWQRLILPDGSSITLDNLPATDAAGYAGLADRTDRHTWQLLKGVALSTLLGTGAELSIGGEGDLVRAVREATQEGASRAGDQFISKSLDVQPTITVRPGWPLRIVVHKDIVLAPWRG
jgi:type IV secretion system protein VirB10